MSEAEMVGQRVGEYVLLEVIGRGGMSIVYRARQARIDRDVAVKLIVPPYSKHPKLVERFVREAQAVARLQHPHILPVLDVGTVDDQPFMVLAYLPGGTLTRQIAGSQGGLSLNDTICYATEIGAALDYAHGQGIIHRDVKPGNVLLDAQGHAYLSDFGVALLAAEDANEESQTPGTYAYMAPEVAMGEPASKASDIYSMGIVIFEMLAGQRPYNVREKAELLAALAADDQPDVLAMRPTLPQGVRVALMQALAGDPESRPGRASSLALALTRAAGMDRMPCPPRRAVTPPAVEENPVPAAPMLSEELATPSPVPDVVPAAPSPAFIPDFSTEDATPIPAITPPPPDESPPWTGARIAGAGESPPTKPADMPTQKAKAIGRLPGDIDEQETSGRGRRLLIGSLFVLVVGLIGLIVFFAILLSGR
jgi:eukaryotic-like serine/threonine-protein kinase